MTFEILTVGEFISLYQKLYNERDVNLKEKIHYFDYNDFDRWGGCQQHRDTLRFAVAYNERDITGVCKFAWWEGSGNYSASYLSVHNDYKNRGISKEMLEVFYKYFSETYPTETLHWTGYSIEGWKYLRNGILKASEKYNVTIKEKPIEFITEWTDENRRLFDESREIIKPVY